VKLFVVFWLNLHEMPQNHHLKSNQKLSKTRALLIQHDAKKSEIEVINEFNEVSIHFTEIQ
jgi:hypothetical protein